MMKYSKSLKSQGCVYAQNCSAKCQLVFQRALGSARRSLPSVATMAQSSFMRLNQLVRLSPFCQASRDVIAQQTDFQFLTMQV
jgi:hypothetical protein